MAHYCPEGTSVPLSCPSGTYNNLTGQWNCTECPAGFYCNENTTSYEIFPCPTGYYCPNGTKHANEYPCPKGTYRDTLMGQSDSDCLPCTAGYYCGTQGLSAVSGQCSAGRGFIYYRTSSFNFDQVRPLIHDPFNSRLHPTYQF